MKQLQSNVKFDYWLFTSTMFASLFGVAALFSLVYKNPGSMNVSILLKQGLAFFIGLAGIVLCSQFNYPTLKTYTLRLYSFSIFLLILVLIIGAQIRGIRSWFILGPISFQPSELAKIAFIIFMAKYIEATTNWDSWRDFLGPFLLFTVPVILILLQPDFGSSLVFFPVLMVMLYVGRAKTKDLLLIASLIIIAGITLIVRMYLAVKGNPLEEFASGIFSSSAIVVFLVGLFVASCIIYLTLKYTKFRLNIKALLLSICVLWAGVGGASIFESFLKEYQKKRLVVFLDPNIDPLGAGYNIIQSKIAIGSGGIFGKGLFSATQSRLGFLPEQHTDFIYSVICEEFGFAGGLLLMIFLGIIVWRSLIIATQARDEFGALVASGIVTMFAFHIFLNIGMTLGIMPITGIPLPFVSYGGTSLVINMLAIGILLNIRMKRFYY